MKAKSLIVVGLLAVLALLPLRLPVYGGIAGGPAARMEAGRATEATVASPAGGSTPVASALSAASVPFIENVGQFDERARFQVRGSDRTIWLAEDAIWVTVVGPHPNPWRLRRHPLPLSPGERGRGPGGWGEGLHGLNLRLTFPGANPHPRLEPFNRLDTVVSYFIGSNPDKWHSNVPVWGGVRYVDIYPGVDLELTGKGGRLTWRFVARDAQFSLSDVRLRVEGAEAVKLLPSPAIGRGAGGEGQSLLLTTGVGDFTLPLLEAVSPDGTPLDLTGVRPELNGAEVTSPLASTPPLPRTPAPLLPGSSAQSSDLLYATFLGGSAWDDGSGIAVDGSGHAYVTGETKSSNFPTTPGAFDTSYNGGWDAFVAKLRADGSGLVYATFLGGSNFDTGKGIAVDGSGSAYVMGETKSSNFPSTPGAFDRSYNGCWDTFVVKLKADGRLAYATFLGGRRDDWGPAIAVDGAGSAYVTGRTGSSDFPTTTGAFDRSYNGPTDAFVAKLAVGGRVGPTHSISGRVRDSHGDLIQGVTVAAGAAGSAVTNAGGYYTISDLPPSEYTLRPSKAGFAFVPETISVTLTGNRTGQNFPGYNIARAVPLAEPVCFPVYSGGIPRGLPGNMGSKCPITPILA